MQSLYQGLGLGWGHYSKWDPHLAGLSQQKLEIPTQWSELVDHNQVDIDLFWVQNFS
jgi:hypothetical protein